MRPARRAVLLLAALVAAPVALTGCRSGSVVHDRYNNFRAYYNTYYNASRSLEEGERALQRPDAPVDRDHLVSVFPTTTAAGGQSGPFQEAIDKSAELLRNRATSKWADDALLVIGKAYFYQRNFAGAEQKFEETMAAADVSGDRRLGDEARFWLGRTLAAAEQYDAGVAVLEEGLLGEEGDRRWTSRMRLALGELYARAGRWDAAAEALAEGAADVGDADLAARAYVLLGQVEEQAGRFEEAAAAYDLALRQQPAYELAFTAEVSRALVLGLDAGQTDEALTIVVRMRGDDKHYERRGELALVQARLYAAAGRADAARALFNDVLYGEDLDARAVRGQAHYRLGEFYRDVAGDYVRASAHFDTAATALPALDGGVRPSRSAVVGIQDLARTYNALAASARRMEEVDSLLTLGALSDDEFERRIEEIEAERRRVYLAEQRRIEAERTAQSFAGGGTFSAEPGQGSSSERPGSDQALPAAETGFLGYRDPGSIQAGLIAFEQRWGDRPLVPNWRRRAAIQAGPVGSTVGGVGDIAERSGRGLLEGPPRLDLSAVPRTPAKREERMTELAGLRYELANAFFLSLGRADTAAVLYRAVLDETPHLPVAVRARYALAEIELTAGREDAARPLYEAVIEMDSTGTLAEASRARLGHGTSEVSAEDAIAAETPAAYDAARQRWRSGAPLEAAAEFLALADSNPDAPLAPRAYLAAAAAYTEWARPDTLLLAGPMPRGLVSPVLLAVMDSSLVPPGGEGGSARSLQSAAPEDATPETAAAEEVSVEPAPADAAAAMPDSTRRPPGRRPPPAARVAPEADPAEAPDPSPLALADTASFTLRHHLTALAARYADTPYAERARQLAAALPAPIALPADSGDTAPILPVPSGDTLTTSLPDAPAPDAPPPPVSDSLAVSPDGPTASALRGDVPLDPSAGGVSWRLRTMSAPSEGASMAQAFLSDGYRTAVVFDESTGMYLLLVGQFETVEEGEETRTDLPAWAQIRAELVPVDDLQLVDGESPDPRP